MSSLEQERLEGSMKNMSTNVLVTSETSEPESTQSLDPSPSNGDTSKRPKFDLNLMDFYEGCSSKESSKRVFKCKYCKNKFSTSQALGGHQNAHRRERAIEKREKLMNDAAMANYDHAKYMLYPYAPEISRFHLHSSPAKNLGSGFNFQSMIQKPYSSHYLHRGFGHGLNNGWSKQTIVEQQQSSTHQLRNGGFQSLEISGYREEASMISKKNQSHQSGSLGLDLSLRL
ncbi:hypothetical protein K2173_015030 [Erythroxylum novogranatense]|uniref:C2H2-type domain-containing protein n=1 Tax=Erythroxylum novogranatense TaxID=1862640 RepID=A0AAV8TVB7_9ROSI|nr:hypothetical protein K2173_015030 [Erythroxylum novogranatense]